MRDGFRGASNANHFRREPKAALNRNAKKISAKQLLMGLLLVAFT
jgi:hypothetical protein